MKFYREIDFQETEIGKIPKEWKVTKLGNIITIKNGKRPLLSKDGLIPVYGANGIMGYTKEFLVDNDYTIVIGRVGASGEVHLAQGKIWISDNALYSEKVDKTKLWLPFLYYLLKTKKLDSLASKTTHPIITQTTLSKLTIQLPPLAEQQKIAEILSTADRAIEDVDKTINRLERLKKALMGELLAGRIRVKEVDGKLTFYRETEFQETEIGKIPKDWKIKKLGELLEFAHGKRPGMLLTNSGIPIYGAGGFYGYTNTYLVNKPAILVIARVGKGSVGKVYLVRGSVWITDNAIYGYSKDPSGLTATYTYYWLIFDKNWVEKYVRRSAGGYAIITLDSLENLKIPVPTIDEQTNIVNVIYLFTKVIELHHEEKIRLERLKRGLMHMLLTGKIRVRES
jgi:type I restriction enzyme S subunit